jgi:hypothetical protein
MKKYVTEYMGYKVPEGATCFVNSCEAYKTHFGKEVDGDEYVYVVDSKDPEWYKISYILPLLSRGAIELPEEEWEPVAGEECEYSQSPINAKCKNWHKDIFIHKHGDLVWLSGGGIITTKNLNFRPLSSVEELEREEFIRLALYHCYNGLESGNMAAAMFDAGFTAPKEPK